MTIVLKATLGTIVQSFENSRLMDVLLDIAWRCSLRGQRK